MPTPALLLYCRAGFEKEMAAEIQAATAAQGISGFVKTKPDSACVTFHCHLPLDAQQENALRFDELVFARQLVFLLQADVLRLPADDRISPLLAFLRDSGSRFRELRMETADTNDAKSLSGFLKKFTPALESALRKAGVLDRRATRTLHLFFFDSTSVHAGWSTADNASPWPLGIPRLRFPSAAPSRSTLKLEEAFLFFMNAEERAEWLREGLTAVDLGAAPGGWTWQLVKHGLNVTAIDNGSMDSNLMASGQVEHLRVDGFHFRPERPVTWLVCDMVEKPARIATLCADWVAEGRASHAMFNLKLPMKRRYEEVLLCHELVTERMDRKRHVLRMKQLYHDREEITAFLVSEPG